MKKYILIFAFLLIGIILINSCTKETRIEPDVPSNPYNGVDYGNNPDLIPIDSASYLGIYELTFSKKCGVPACHDGAFEPDFRTIEGSYNQLVYHNVLKNNATNDFTYRVVPNDTGSSWLHERITTDNTVLGKMPLYDVLADWQVKDIEKWILNGAKDIFGNSSNIPNLEPTTGGVLAYLNDTSGIRLDTARDNAVSPIKLPASSIVQLWFLVYDTDASGGFIPGGSLTYNKLKISTHPFDFSGASIYNMNLLPLLSPAFLPLPFNSTQLGPYYHNYTINTSAFIPGKTYYMRTYVKDSGSQITEIPENGSQVYLSTYFAFIVQ